MPVDVDVVIVGGSVAAARCAESLRSNGFGGSVTLVSDETHAPCDRPPLSKQFLAGQWPAERLTLLDAERAASLDIELRLGVPAVALAAEAHQLELADGTTVRYRCAVVATGALARESPWGTPAGVHTLRSLADSHRLREVLVPGARLVVVGGGWIGAEVAATAAGRGCAVTVVDAVDNPYARSLGDAFGRVVATVHARHGVATRFGAGVNGLRPLPGGTGVRVNLSGGSSLDADAVVVGIGAVPNTEWLVGSELQLDDGVVCDSFGRATRAPDVWAVGDAARWAGRRQEHWTSAVEQARAVAHNLSHPGELVGSASDGYVWSDQYDWKIQLAGHTGAGLECELVEVEPAQPGDRPRIAALYGDEQGTLAGVAALNWPKAVLGARREIGRIRVAAQAEALRTSVQRVTA